MKQLPLSLSSKWLRWPVASLRTYLVLVIIVATVPLGGLTSWLMAREIYSAREQLTNGLLQSAASLALLVEREQVSSVDALKILSNTQELRSEDLPAFHRLLTRLPHIRPAWRRVMLMDAQGRLLLSNDASWHPLAQGVSASPNEAVGTAPVRLDGPRVTDLIPSSTEPGQWLSRIEVPVVLRGQTRYVLAAEIDAKAWQSLMTGVNAPDQGFVTMFDGGDRIVARSLKPAEFVGKVLPQVSRERMRGKTSGVQKMHTIEGIASYVAWQRMPYGWGVGVGVNAQPLDQANERAISAAVSAGLISMLAGLALAFVVVRRVNQPLKALAEGGARAVTGDIAVREIALLRDAMAAAEQQREQARERLEAKAAEFETLFNTSPIGLSITLDPSCREVLRNPAKLAMFNMRPGKPDTFVLLEQGEVLPPERHPLQRAARGEAVWNQELEVRHEDGRVLKLLAHGVPLLDAQGRPRGGIATFVDITERMQAQERLMRAQARLQDSQHLVELAQEAGDVGFFDHLVAAGTVTMTSGLARLFGLARRSVEMNWNDWLQRVHPEDAGAIHTLLQQAFETGQEHVVFKFRTAGDASGSRWLSSRMVIMYAAHRQASRVIGVMVDVTSQQLVEQERARLIAQEQKARLDAENANRAKDEFLAMLGHELRNPLSAISAAIEVLNRVGMQSDPAERARTIITRQTRHLARLMDDLLDVARVIAGKIHLARQPVNLAATVQRLINTMSMAGQLQAHPIELDVDDTWVHADAMRLDQIVNNLIHNAVKYSGPEQRICVRVKQDGALARLQVIDEGPGIPPELLPHIFDLFVQGERSLDRRQGGLGIGLTLVKSLVELHEGRISVATSPQGSTFTVDLPLAAGPDIVRPVQRDTPAGQREVVVVEDNPDAREAMSFMLELKGHKVWAEADGVAGLARILEVRPHLALVDIGLPGLTGYQVAQQARGQGFGGWMVSISGYGQPQDVRRAIESGFDAHLVKPIDEAVLDDYLGRGSRVAEALGA